LRDLDVMGCERDTTEVMALRRRYPNVRLDVVDVTDNGAVRDWATSLEGGGAANDGGDDDGGTGMYLGDVVIVVIATGSAGGGGSKSGAGTSPSRDIPAWEVSREAFDATIAFDVAGASNVIRHFVPRMIRHRNARVDVAASSGVGGYGGDGGGGTLVTVCTATPHRHRAAQCAAACAIVGLIGSVALSVPGPHCAATLSPGCVTFEGGKSMFLSREGSDRGGASEGGDVDLERWANVAAGPDQCMPNVSQMHSRRTAHPPPRNLSYNMEHP
jgi:NAD(P)-dependent dehydrogenase (short-subunit alcohol dehydrogenase family)